jgi:hypothetical protein
MLLQKEKIIKLMWQKGLTVKYLAARLMLNERLLVQVLLGHKKLGYNRARLMIEMFGAYDIADAIDWVRMGKVNPLAEVM